MTEKFVLHVTDEELATILGALRWYQESELWHRDARPDWLDEIVTDGGTLAGLDDLDIELLVLDLNCPVSRPDVKDNDRYMDLGDALDIVHELAKQNVIDDPELAEERKRQLLALDVVEDFIVNHFGEV